ncbi:DUF885 domain-containing protein [Mucilaginibacter sp. L3T2-6]|uniref:DUF885 domain-containing protein n=1 Tax=Mucilaginibacter sp. L3T2-6 TaxID=3062491 RepID=UPI002676DEF8|nr:DUF885 domain-containing protein [Mucilaginibacter sp. L3T2-6]MDO3642113.1 DUF885 domain-containing protein [Mucilaginibacter sp. L3T2-6]MDV6214607.1 DUF885 domain-containing protein [Mucilaginibacter sp. L3T2-6]
MKKLLLFIPLVLFFSCEQKTKTTATAVSGDEAFEKLADNYISGYLTWRPATGVALGYHQYDGKVTNLGKESLGKELGRLKDFDQQLAATDTTSLSPKEFYDYRILRSAIKLEIFNFEDMGTYDRNPMTYAGAVDVSIYIKRDFAPLQDRLKSIIAIEKNAPNVFAAAKENLKDTLAKPYVETAIEIAHGSADFLGGDLKLALKDIKNDSLMKEFNVVNKSAIAAINDYATWLQKQKLPKAGNKYAIGKASYQKMLLYNEDITLAPEKILEIGLNELKKEQAVFNAAAKTINPNKKPIDVYHDLQEEHPTAENLIPEVRKNVDAIRKFLTDKSILSMPGTVNLKVTETPQFARATSTASNDDPGPFETKATEAFYYITPVDQKWTAKQKEDWLRQFDYYTTDNITIHEAYPGHYAQFLHLNESAATRIEKMFGSYAFVEGWAHYCEKMMADAGYGHNGDTVRAAKYRLAQSGDALLRLCRLCVSIKTHCQGMNLKDATKFFMDNWYQGEKPSYQEALRGTFDPGYLFYTLGKLEILKLRTDYEKQEGANFSLRKFHDEMLSHGMPQIRLLREVMLKDKKIWTDVL